MLMEEMIMLGACSLLGGDFKTHEGLTDGQITQAIGEARRVWKETIRHLRDVDDDNI